MKAKEDAGVLEVDFVKLKINLRFCLAQL